MISLSKFAALGAATVGTAAVASLAWVNVGRAPRTAQPRSPASDRTIVCVASDDVIRIASGTGCPSGQTPLPLAMASPSSSDPSEPSRRPDSRIADLERRLTTLDKSPLFTVVDNDDHPMFAVMPGRAVVYYPSSADEAISLRATDDGGSISMRSPNDALKFNVEASSSRTGLWVEKDGVTRLELGANAIGTYSLKIRTSQSKVVAGIGESAAGTGAIVVANREGKTLASMTVTDDNELHANTSKGAIGVFNRAGVAVLSFTEGATGGGLLAIGDATGAPMVKLGVKDDRYGVVLAGPRAGFPLVPRSGLPGSYFLGCASGSACVP